MALVFAASKGDAVKAATCSPWHDALRFRYEAGATVADLAYWYSTSRAQMTQWLAMAGTEFTHRRSKRV